MTGIARNLKPAPVRKTLFVNAAPARAFEVFARDMTRWWPARHSRLKTPLEDTIVQPHAKGRWYQIGTDGTECDIGYVLAWEPPHRLLLAWQLDADWQFNPDLATEIEVQFIAEAHGRTRVEFEHRLLERMGEKADDVREQIAAPDGWPEILDSYLQSANA